MVGVTKAAAAALGFRSLLSDLGAHWPLRVHTDSSASIGMCTRQGVGRVRHMDTQAMWIQQRIRNNDLDLYKVAGEANPADLLTKADIPRDRAEELLKLLNCEFEGGRAATAPKLRSEGGKKLFAALPSHGGLSQSLTRQSGANPQGKPYSPTGRSGSDLRGELRALAEGAPRPGQWSCADELEAQLVRGREHPEGAPVRAPPAPEEAPEAHDELIAHGERLGSAGRGRAPLENRNPPKSCSHRCNQQC